MKYLQEIKKAIDNLPKDKIQEVIEIIKATKGTIYIFGNGGSAATASHFACDLNKMTDKKAICLNDSPTTITAIANDESYSYIFINQLIKLMQLDDVVIGISGRGNSENVLTATRYARVNGAKTIGLTGFDGGGLKFVKYPIIVPAHDMQIVEDIHLMIIHMIVRKCCEH